MILRTRPKSEKRQEEVQISLVSKILNAKVNDKREEAGRKIRASGERGK
jgi:hypothetical protein